MNLALMRQIDEQFLETPFFGVRQMTWHLKNEGHLVNEKCIRRLMRLMSLMPIYQKPNTSRLAKGHKIWPYLLRGLRVDARGQAKPGLGGAHHVSADAPWLPLSCGNHGLVHPQGAGLAHLEHVGSRLLDQALNEALHKFGSPEIMKPTRAASLRPSRGRIGCAEWVSASRWTAKADSWHTSSSNGYGARSNTSASICMPGKPDHRRGPAFEKWMEFYNGKRDRIPPLAANRLL